MGDQNKLEPVGLARTFTLIRIYRLDKQGKPIHFDNLDGLPDFNRWPVIHFNRSPEFSVDLHISPWRQSLFGNTALADHRPGNAGSLQVIGPPDKWKKHCVFDNPKTDDTPEKPQRQHNPVLDNNQNQYNCYQTRNIQQNVSKIDRFWYFFQVQIQYRSKPYAVIAV
jgi:hypothetical protein